ncbi:MAG: CPBP family intramembrane metalloprotease [Thermomicrobiales bacterium]|nr:CPBP family intramembrane metalloprotease [Thermomicrobiales bacterium]
MGNSVQILISAATLLLGALGLAYWANRAQSDRSAFVGLYLLFGIPGGLMLVAGLAMLVNGNTILGVLLLLVGLGLTLPLISAVRVGLAEVMPLDPDSAIDMAGLCVVLGALGWFAANSLVPMAANPPDISEIPSVSVAELVVQAAALLALAYIAVGFPYWRDLRQATERLGIVAPDLRTIGLGLAGTLGAFLIAGLAGFVAQQLNPALGDSLTEIVDTMTAQVQNPIGAVILGASAGIGEEAVFRGALQPRFGMVLPSLLFTMLHGPQYGFNVALLGLFGVSMILALLRRHANTTAAMIAHALYNAVQVLALSMIS